MATLTSLALCLVATSHDLQQDVVRDRVDLIEVNHFYDEKGHLFLEQMIFYEWCSERSHYDIRAYRLLKSPIQIPRRDYDGQGYVAIWRDGPVLRKVYAKTIRESWTQYDPEIVERTHLAKENRRNLQRVVRRRATPDQYQNGVPRHHHTADAGTRPTRR